MNTVLTSLALIGNLGTWELFVILAIGLLIFGRRLPEVGRSLGKGIVEFKKGLKGVEDEIDDASSQKVRSPREFPRPGEDDRRVSREETPQKVSEPQA
ncbi:MAG: Sec-independent protein translocase subunit TatA/TatB [Phycisphaerales bacterium]